jgi:minor teichoic acid biosynthesis protein ggaB
MHEDLVSVIVPVYNVENYLRECLDSIVVQTYRNIEVILIDDGSNDSSGEICDEYADKDNRIKVIHKENGGVSAARNTGLDIAKGEWISYVDSDDYIESTMLETLICLAKENDIELAICSFKDISECENVTQENDIRIFSKDELIYNYVVRNADYCITEGIWDRIYKRVLVDGLRFKNDRINEDILYTMEVFTRAHKAVYTSEKLYNYRAGREGNITGRKATIDSIKDKIYCSKNSAKILRESGNEELADIFECIHFLEISELLIFNGEKNNDDILNYKRYMRPIVKKVLNYKNVSKKIKAKLLLVLINPSLLRISTIVYSKIKSIIRK